ncbi:hypothetical protein SLS58_000993 [Diplodia intermedia]|uniref:Heterokaryon incompatibility domain-containing protein n=1 Tax=Diplodia intermedia TaxID=856260 RepID=A0ABR3U4P5_9PEZI
MDVLHDFSETELQEEDFETVLPAIPDGIDGPDDISTIPVEPDSANETSRRYVYAPIQQDREIRLAILHPATIAEPVHCTLVRMDVENLPPFEAVSYTWADQNGDSSPCKSILCGPGRRRLAVTSNCENVLRRLRLTNLKRLIWIDSVCIDQSNMGERTHQVRWMSRIYSSAFRVLVYLGEASESSKALFDSLNGTARIEEAMMRSPSSSYRLSHDILASIRLQVTKGVDELFTRPWFFRTWVIQEAALAKQAVAICGNDFVPWNSLSIINLNLTSQPFKPFRWAAAGGIRRGADHPPKDFSNHVPPTIRLQLGHTDRSRSLWNLVRDVRACRASDPRDKIFAVLGLANDADHARRPFAPDYSKTVAETYLDFATHLVSESKASLADVVRESQSRTRIAEVPSWVPDWSAEEPTSSFAVARDFMALLPRAQPGPETDISTPVVSRGGTLDFPGKEIDVVHCVDAEYAPGKPIIRKIVRAMPTYPSLIVPWITSWWQEAFAGWEETGSFHGIRVSGDGARVLRHLNELFLRILASCSPHHRSAAEQLPSHHRTMPCTACLGPLSQSFASLLSMLEESGGRPGSSHWTLFLGEDRIFVGAGPLAMMEGDAVCLLAGLELPWVLRPHRDGYRLVGECAFFEPGEHCGRCEPPEPRGWKRMIVY